MHNLKVSAITVLLLSILLFMHVYGMSHHLYMAYWYYDIFSHFLAGVSVAMSVYCITIILNIKFLKEHLWTIILLTFIAGFAWEWLEVDYDIAGYKLWTTPYYLDSLYDLINDVLGSSLIWLIIKLKTKKQ